MCVPCEREREKKGIFSLGLFGKNFLLANRKEEKEYIKKRFLWLEGKIKKGVFSLFNVNKRNCDTSRDATLNPKIIHRLF